MRSASLLIILAVACSGRPFYVAAVSPITPPKQRVETGRLSLRFGLQVEDRFVLAGRDGVGPIEVSEWRTSLLKGFENALSPSASIIAFDPDLTVILEAARFSLSTTGRGQIAFRARLVDARGKTVTRARGTAQSRRPCFELSCTPDAMRGAIAALYETLATQLFSPPALTAELW